MLKILLTTLISFSLLFAFSVESLENVPCAPELKNCLEAIQQLPEGRELITSVQKEGPVSIQVNKINLPKEFGAFWDLDNRIIYVNLSPDRNQGEQIGSILFELHNALRTSQLAHLDNLAMQGKIDREHYTEAVERLEYQNSIEASAISVKGIKQGIFPETAYLPVYPSFQEHYRIQKMHGHSAFISQTYDQLTGKI